MNQFSCFVCFCIQHTNKNDKKAVVRFWLSFCLADNNKKVTFILSLTQLITNTRITSTMAYVQLTAHQTHVSICLLLFFSLHYKSRRCNSYLVTLSLTYYTHKQVNNIIYLPLVLYVLLLLISLICLNNTRGNLE